MRIAVLSDTHDHLPHTLPKRLADADEIWHLGDVCAPATLAELELLGKPLQVIQGNCDAPFPWPLELRLTREGVVFYLTHIPPASAPTGVDVVLHGHTHYPRQERVGNTLWLNPGSASQPRGSAAGFAWLEVEHGKLTAWRLEPI